MESLAEREEGVSGMSLGRAGTPSYELMGEEKKNWRSVRNRIRNVEPDGARDKKMLARCGGFWLSRARLSMGK